MEFVEPPNRPHVQPARRRRDTALGMARSHRGFKFGLTKWLSAEVVIRAEPLRGLQGLFLAQCRDTREYVFRRYAPILT